MQGMVKQQGKYNNAPTCRQTVASEVTEFAQSLANRAQSLAERVEGKLNSVMTSAAPRDCGDACSPSVEYPPLFSELRNSLQGIEASLNTIEYALSRTEL